MKIVTDQKLSVAEFARQLEVGENLLRDWKKAYVKWAESHYVPRRKKDDQNRFIRYAVKVVRRAFGRTPAAEFGPKRLRAVQQALSELDWCRSTINA